MSVNKCIVMSAAALAFVISSGLWAAPISQEQAQDVVLGWLGSDAVPMGEQVGNRIAWTDAYDDANGVCLYYIVYLDPSGFVIVSADDMAEPVVGFVTGYAYFDPSPSNVMGAMVSRDLPRRVSAARQAEQRLQQDLRGQNLTQREAYGMVRSLNARAKWRKLRDSATPGPARGTSGISDVRVAPLLYTTWGQDNVSGSYCYNYYTPNHYYDGCVATAMAQFMRYWQWPATGIGVQTNTIYVNGSPRSATTRGGDGLGGPYDWSRMMLSPNSSITAAQRQAIGALCYDAGVAVRMQYSPSGSGAYMSDAANALRTTFRYNSAVMGGNQYSNVGTSLKDMINANLDSGNPVLLAIIQSSSSIGHAIVADGYGYNSLTLYHHLNLGWDGIADAWYNLPDVDTGYYAFNVVAACIYNIYTTGNGEIISGRITHSSGEPLPGAIVTATGTGGPYTAVSNANGIYALARVRSNTAYTITVAVPGCSFDSLAVTTGLSSDNRTTTGNRAGIDFTTDATLPTAPAASAFISYPASSATGRYTVSWTASNGATAYELVRSLDGGNSWLTIYAGTDTSYAEDLVASGSYRYCVRAMNAGGVSNWTPGSDNCLVNTLAPAAPQSITYPATSTTGTYAVTWAASSAATAYMLRRSNDNESTWTQVYTGQNAYYSENIGAGTYRYSVKAYNANGTSDWTIGATSCVVSTAPPAMPAAIAYPTTSSTGIYTVSWTVSTGATSYTLKRSSNGGSTWTQVYTGQNASYSENVSSGTYRYSVCASSGAGNSTYRTGTLDCKVSVIPSAPATIDYPQTSAGTHLVSWAASANATSYTLRRSKDGGKSWTIIYSGSKTSLSQAIGNGRYRYCVKAVNSKGSSIYTTGTFDCVVLLAPARPASIYYPTKSSTGIYKVHWSRPSGATSYVLRRSQDGGLTWTDIYTGTAAYYYESLGAGKYRYSVAAVNSSGSSTYKTGTSSCVVRITFVSR